MMVRAAEPRPPVARTARSASWERVGLLLGAIGSALVFNEFVLRLFAGTDLWRGLLLVAYCAAASAALLLGPGAVKAVLGDSPRASPAFLIACAATAVAGMVAAFAAGGQLAGGTALLFYWAGLGLMWAGFVAMAWWGGAKSAPIRRDWTIYSYALALLPLTTLPAVPLWGWVAALDLNAAVITSVTLAFPLHLLAAHFVIFEKLERRRVRGHGPSARS